MAFLCGNIGASDHLSFFCFLPLFYDTNISKISSYVGCLGLDSCRPWLQFGSIKKWISCEFHPLTSEVSFDVTSVHPVVVTDMRLIHDIHYMKQKTRRVYLSADGVTLTSTSIPISSSPLSLFIFFFLLLSLLLYFLRIKYSPYYEDRALVSSTCLSSLIPRVSLTAPAEVPPAVYAF